MPHVANLQVSMSAGQQVPSIANFFQDQDRFCPVPDEVHSLTHDKVVKFIHDHVDPAADVPKLTSRAIAERICRFQGEFCWPKESSAPHATADGSLELGKGATADLSGVERVAVEQIRYDAMPAKIVAGLMKSVVATTPVEQAVVVPPVCCC